MSVKGFKFYVFFIHFLIALILIKSDFIHKVSVKFGAQPEEITDHYHRMVAYHSRIDKNIPPNSILFIGDSHIQGLAVSAIAPNAVNFGIGGDTTRGLLDRLSIYQSLISSKAVVLEIGFNDIHRRDNGVIIENFVRILEFMPSGINVILCAVHPVGKNMHNALNRRIEELNNSLELLSSNRSNVTFLSPFAKTLSKEGFLPSEYHLSDSVHLSQKGYELWISTLILTLNNEEFVYGQN